jgi:hypothetical protein
MESEVDGLKVTLLQRMSKRCGDKAERSEDT